MKFSDKFVRSNLELAKPLATNAGLDTARAFQDRAGRILKFITRREVVIQDENFDGVKGCIVIPRDEVRSGIILYIHGGGYVSGRLDYAKGFAGVLSSECGTRVATFEYSLAPEAPFPTQLDESFRVYCRLLASGYKPESIVLAGESAGGGLAYALALRLREARMEMPAGIIAISPWCDLTLSGASHTENRERDPSLSRELLSFYADLYADALEKGSDSPRRAVKKENYEVHAELFKNPYVSPAFADFSAMPPTLIFAGGDEILRSDAETVYERYQLFGSEARLVIRPEMWHAYHLYRLKSSDGDFALINAFLKSCLPADSMRKLRWLTLDNAAKIYPAARTANWTNVFRLSATLKENVDREVLQSALDVTVRRFPSIAVRIRRGAFWYYLEEIAHAPEIADERAYPLVRMPFDDIRTCAFRVIIYKKRIAIEFFHALTDGNGGLVFLKSLVAEYLTQKYGVRIPNVHGVLDRLETPSEEELTDLFPKHAGRFSASRKEPTSYRIWGEPEEDGFCCNTTMMLSSSELLEKAHLYGVTVTSLLVAAIIKAGISLQNADVRSKKRQKPIRVLVPCDLRRVYNAKTMRNFALYSTPGIDPRLGEYSFREICDIVHKQMALDITPKNMSARIKTNVKDEENKLLKVTPLFLKNIVMKAVFMMVGEKKSMLTLSNLGVIKIPDEMREFIERFDFVLSVQSKAPYNIGTLTYGDTAYINIIRNIKEPRLEYALYKALRDEGISVKVESNQR